MSEVTRKKAEAERLFYGKLKNWYDIIKRRAVNEASPLYEVSEGEKSKLSQVLNEGYEAVIRKTYKGNLQERKKPELLELKRKINERFKTAYKRKTELHADYITRSTERLVKTVYYAITTDKEGDNESGAVTGAELKKRLEKVLKSRFRNKARMDAVTETNWSAESARNIAVFQVDEMVSKKVNKILTLLERTKKEKTPEEQAEDEQDEELLLLLLLARYSERSETTEKLVETVKDEVEKGRSVQEGVNTEKIKKKKDEYIR